MAKRWTVESLHARTCGLTLSSTSARWFQGTIETDSPMRMQAIRTAKHAQMIPTSRRGLSFIVARSAALSSAALPPGAPRTTLRAQ